MTHYTLRENRLDDLGVTREYFIDTPNGRMSVRLPEFLSMEEHSRRLRLIINSLNGSETLPDYATYNRLIDALHRLYGVAKYLHPDDVQENDAEFEKQYSNRMKEALKALARG